MAIPEGLAHNRLAIRDLPADSDVPALPIFDKRASIVDSTGVPLDSDRVKDKSLIANINFDKRPNIFTDSPSRFKDGKPHPKPMSEFERRRLHRHYPEIMAIVSQVRNSYIDNVRNRRFLGNYDELSAKEMQAMLRGLFFLPHYLTARANSPVEAQGVIPPAIVILSNAASGTLGSLQVFLERHGHELGVLSMPPDPEEMIAETEAYPGQPLVGGTSVCVASPRLMHHFMSSVIQGPRSHYANRFDLAPWLSPEEVSSMAEFGNNAYEADSLIEGFGSVDLQTADTLKRFKRKKRKQSQIPSEIDKYLSTASRYRVQLEFHQMQANRALGRSIYAPAISLDFLEERFNLKTPKLIRELS